MKKPAFTMLEILIALIIISIVTSFALITYEKTIAISKDKICLQNLKILQAAVDIYTLEKDTIPTTLSQLEPRQIHLAYLKVVGQPKENHFWVFFRNVLGVKQALAARSLDPLCKYYGNNATVLRCPFNPDQSIPQINNNNTHSYQLNPNDGEITDGSGKLDKRKVFAIVYDKNTWHNKGTYANGITPGKIEGQVDLSNRKVAKAAQMDTDNDGEISMTECDDNCMEKCTED